MLRLRHRGEAYFAVATQGGSATSANALIKFFNRQIGNQRQMI
jgi:hypothetical protein